ncbi:DUF2637 domain-containing protein, partial [Streptomyces sp. NPDC005122]
TADKHMEGVRLTRWMLSPLPTFLLWRRMKLWELRSYEQVIKLEQERLVYQARLRSRFGRAWRRKAPVESLMPLRLARYGVPLAETAPSGLAAAGIEQPAQISVERVPALSTAEEPAVGLSAAPEPAAAAREASTTAAAPSAAVAIPRPRREAPAEEPAERFAVAYQAFLTQFQVAPTAAQWGLWLRDRYGISTGAGKPLSGEQLQPLLQVLRARYATADSERPVGEEESADQSWYDYFHSAWQEYKQRHGLFPDAAALAAYLYERDAITGDGGQPISGADLAGFVASFEEREFGDPALRAEEPTGPLNAVSLEGPVNEGDVLAAAGTIPALAPEESQGPRGNVSVDEQQPSAERGGLTAPDRYYLAWMEYQEQNGSEPSDEQLSAFCAEKGLLGRGRRPISPANLRRHFLRWRVYNAWAEQQARTQTPGDSDVAQVCAEWGITAQYNKPVTSSYVAEESDDFERRWLILSHQQANVQP